MTVNLRDSKLFKDNPPNLLLIQKRPEVQKSRTLNPVSPEPPGLHAQAPRRLWERECLLILKVDRHISDRFLPLLVAM